MNITPHEKLHKDAVFVTVAVMFATIIKLVPALQAWAEKNPTSGLLAWLGAGLAASFTARPVYTVISSALAAWAQSQTWLKRRYLGRAFMHGTWYGVLRTKRGHLRLYVEQYDQNFDELTIRGTSFRTPKPRDRSNPELKADDFRQGATWITRATRINGQTGELYCFYENNVVRKHYPVLAVGHFNLEYSSDNFPSELRGYAIDVDAGIELAIDAIADLQRSPEEAGIKDPPVLTLSKLDQISKVRLSYERLIKVRRDAWYTRGPLRRFADVILTTEEAKKLAFAEFSTYLHEAAKEEFPEN